MAPEIVRKLIGGQWRTVEENAGGGGGSSALLSASITKTAAELNVADSQANGIELVPAPGAGNIIVPLAMTVGTAAPDSTGDGSLALGFGTTGTPISPASPIYPFAGDGFLTLAQSASFAAAGDIGQPVNLWVTDALDNGPFVITLLYTITATA